MTEPKWIPGPYAVDPDYRAGMAYNRHIVLDRDHDQRIAFMAHDGEAGDPAFKATADLLAAAPELYEALAGLFTGGFIEAGTREWNQWSKELATRLEPCRAALSKARGE